jgi:hypothetical protein
MKHNTACMGVRESITDDRYVSALPVLGFDALDDADELSDDKRSPPRLL